ncbi:hypothetical protein A5N82_11400 [Christensenella minuta]|uniref:Uncharacterized protein n=1 Tax=Christensenella minuta TaxID=626937 RepID=A0A136Q7R8_9FIRM|nr:hypothetical protein B1H56_10270 [Christensenella minuta]KXK66606.1 hypothetical protein HMPREF3293_00649 [Christensenella minuta]OAQ41024.1 hypothetical protein A5N82_11400 [Christensenella minuta]
MQISMQIKKRETVSGFFFRTNAFLRGEKPHPEAEQKLYNIETGSKTGGSFTALKRKRPRIF